MVHLEFKTLGDQKELHLLGRFVEGQQLWYPNYTTWVHTVCIPELDSGYKSAIICWHHGMIVGNIIFQKHKELPGVMELKNVRVDPNFRGEAIGYFLLRQSEKEAREHRYTMTMADIDVRQKDMVALLRMAGYQTLGKEHLYSDDALDVIMVRELTRRRAA